MPNLKTSVKSVWPPPEVVCGGFSRPRFVRLRLDRFPRGADNLRIDVALGSVLAGVVDSYVAALVREKTQRLWKQPVSAFSDTIVRNFRTVLEDHQRAVVKSARAVNRLERVQLYQLALLKLFLGSVDSGLARLREELDEARAEPTRQMTGQSLQFHHQAVILGRNLEHIRYQVLRELMREYMHVERGALRNLRKSVLGVSWPVPEPMLNNPMLQLDGIGGVRDFYQSYPLLLRDPDSLRHTGRCVLAAFADWLPEHVLSNVGNDAAAGVSRLDHGMTQSFREVERRVQGLVGDRELNDCFSTWLDRPANAVALLGGTEGHWPQRGNWRHPGIARLQRDLNKRLLAALSKAGLVRAMVASYELQAVYPVAGLVGAEALVFDYFSASLNRREFLRRLEGMDGIADPTAMVRRIDELRKQYKAGAGADRRQQVARFAGDFLRLRRDLKLGWCVLLSMDSLRLVEEDALDRRQDQHRLQVFCRREAAVETSGSIVGHVIVKADVRGIAIVTTQMRHRRLDPASHFSRFLYDPVTRLLEQFGARKVVVEGDAVILSLLEHSGEGAEALAVARGCCIAAKLIRLVRKMNVEHERIGLDRIELGIGVAYADEAPTYLYDHARKVTISPAIQRARLLSSCHPVLRKTCPLPSGHALCVASPVERETGQTGEELVRYNVNGIELDAGAFTQLNVEIALKRLSRRGDRPATFYIGQCPDVKGESHWVLVRERDVRLWIGGRLLETEKRVRCYYEVISDSRLVARLRAKLPQDETADLGATPPPWH